MEWSRRVRIVVLALVAGVPASGCALRIPFTPFYTPATLEADRVEVRLDVPYRTDAGADPEKHRLDLFLPRRPGWPLLAFVHGGSLEKGDSALRLGGHDIYRNIGRFYASRGVGVALINYRLQPDVLWPAQVDDVAAAAGWLIPRLKKLGGDGTFFLSGHSAGSWLVSQVALDPEVQRRYRFDVDDIEGVISVSGSGFDLTDDLTWEMFGREEIWRRRFSVAENDPDWKRNASLIPLLRSDAPPFLLLFSSHEWRALRRQNRLMCDAAETLHVGCELVEVGGEGHIRMVLAMSDPRRDVAPRILTALGVDPAAVERERRPDQSTTRNPDVAVSSR